jgi:hypothetical protein
MPGDLLIEFAGNSSDGGFVSNIRRSKTPGGHTTEVFAKLKEYHRPAVASCLYGSRYAARSCSVNTDIDLDGLAAARETGNR